MSEVHATVEALGDKYRDRIPKNEWQAIVARKNNEYVPFVDKDKPLEKQGFCHDTLVLIAYLRLNYWCDTDEERARFEALLRKNDELWETKLAQEKSVRNLLKLMRRE